MTGRRYGKREAMNRDKDAVQVQAPDDVERRDAEFQRAVAEYDAILRAQREAQERRMAVAEHAAILVAEVVEEVRRAEQRRWLDAMGLMGHQRPYFGVRLPEGGVYWGDEAGPYGMIGGRHRAPLWPNEALLRGEKLLKSVLGAQQYDELYRRGFIEVPSTIYPEEKYQIRRHKKDGSWDHLLHSPEKDYLVTFCAYPYDLSSGFVTVGTSSLCGADSIAGIYLALKANEAHFLQKAVRGEWRGLDRYSVEMNSPIPASAEPPI